MKIIKILAIIIGVIVVIIFVGGLFIPRAYSVSRSNLINASDSVIYKNVADFHEFYKWNPWAKMEPTATTTFGGVAAQPGHTYQWVGKETGSGQMKIKAVEANEMVDIELRFIKPFESLADTRFYIMKETDGYKVSWTMSGESKNIMAKWMSLMMDKMIGKDFEDGLKYLKSKSEKGE